MKLLLRALTLSLFLLSAGGTGKAIAGDWFKYYPNAGIPGHNTKVLRGIGATAGKAECLKYSWCRSFDVKKSDGTVYLQDKNQGDRGVGGLRYDYPGDPYDHYERRYDRD